MLVPSFPLLKSSPVEQEKMPIPLVFTGIFSFPNPRASENGLLNFVLVWILFFFPKGLRALDSSCSFLASSISLNYLILTFIRPKFPQNGGKTANIPVRPKNTRHEGVPTCFKSPVQPLLLPTREAQVQGDLSRPSVGGSWPQCGWHSRLHVWVWPIAHLPCFSSLNWKFLKGTENLLSDKSYLFVNNGLNPIN